MKTSFKNNFYQCVMQGGGEGLASLEDIYNFDKNFADSSRTWFVSLLIRILRGKFEH
jgi:hypothetical protein